jgi:general stress protein 26
MVEQTGRNEDIEKLGKLIKDIKVAMMTTVDTDGTLRSRPMRTQQQEFDGDLWFFTETTSPKVDELRRDAQVNLSYADAGSQTYVSVSGQGELVRDRKKIEELWNPLYKAWFPEGLETPNLGLIRVRVDKAEYWDSPNGKVVQLVGFVKSLATGERVDAGENKKVEL